MALSIVGAAFSRCRGRHSDNEQQSEGEQSYFEFICEQHSIFPIRKMSVGS
jgi:hypothetical protein